MVDLQLTRRKFLQQYHPINLTRYYNILKLRNQHITLMGIMYLSL